MGPERTEPGYAQTAVGHSPLFRGVLWILVCVLCSLVLTVAGFGATAGSLDRTFGNKGIVSVPVANKTFDVPVDATLLPEGKIIAIARFADNNQSKFLLLKFNADGSPDVTFGNDGQIICGLGNQNAEPSAIVAQPDGKFLVAGFWSGSGGTSLVIRFTDDGSFDTSFGGGNGIAQGWIGYATSIALEDDGNVVIGGYYQNTVQSSGMDFFVERFTESGEPDSSFDGDGGAVTSVSSADGADIIQTIVTHDGGKILVGDWAINRFAMARFGPPGSSSGYSGG